MRQRRLVPVRAGPGAYHLDDELRYGDGVVVAGATASNTVPGSIATSSTWDGQSDTRIVSDVAIAGGTSHTYQVLVDTEPLPSASTTAGDCQLEEEEEGTGFLNTSLATSNGVEQDDAACAQVPTTTDASTRDCELDEGEEGSGFLNEATVTQGSALLDDDACALSSGIENPDPGDPSAPIDRIDRVGGTSGYGRLASTGTSVAVLVLLGIGLVGIGGRMVRLGRGRHEERP